MRRPTSGLICLAMLTVGMAVGRYTAPVDRDASGADAGPVADTAGEPVSRSLEATVYLPLSDNQGRPFPEEEWSAALEALVARFGGATLGEPREGCWLDDRRRIRCEPVRPVASASPTGGSTSSATPSSTSAGGSIRRRCTSASRSRGSS